MAEIELVEDVEIYPAMVALAGELEAQLKARGVSTAEAAVLPEGIAVLDFVEDDCDGIAWVRLAGAFPSTDFPSPDAKNGTCASMMAFQVEVGFAHCAPEWDIDNRPTIADQLEAARVQTTAMAAMRSAIAVVMDELERPYSLGSYNSAIAGGNMLGATWQVTLGDRRG